MLTRKERWLGALRLQPVDRLPFFAKLDAAYPLWQEPPFSDMDVDAIHDWIGSDAHPWVSECTKEVRRDSSLDVVKENGVRRTLFNTRHGSLEFVEGFDAASQAWHPVKHPVHNPEDVSLLTEFYADCTVELDEKGLEAATAQQQSIGSGPATGGRIGESPLMYWLEYLAGVERGHYLLADHRQLVEG